MSNERINSTPFEVMPTPLGHACPLELTKEPEASFDNNDNISQRIAAGQSLRRATRDARSLPNESGLVTSLSVRRHHRCLRWKVEAIALLRLG
jgi:hypothetical protein